jgi:hypothetical protein
MPTTEKERMRREKLGRLQTQLGAKSIAVYSPYPTDEESP